MLAPGGNLGAAVDVLSILGAVEVATAIASKF